MSVIVETTLGDLTIDLFVKERPRTCLNFLKLCKVKYYNFCLFHSVQRNFVAQTGDPTGVGRGGESIFQSLYGDQATYFESEVTPKIKHRSIGTVSMVNDGNGQHGSQFLITLGENLDYLDGVHSVFGEIVEGLDVLMKINETFCDNEHRPFRDIRITHTVILDDPLDDPPGLIIPDRSPEPTDEQLQSLLRIGADEEIDDNKGLTEQEVTEKEEKVEADHRAQVLEMIGDLPDKDVKPPDNILFVCKLNPVTTDEDLEIIFSRFGTILSCEIIRDYKSGDSLQYAFVEFNTPEECEKAYLKMDNVLIDDRRIHVDFSQSVSKMDYRRSNDPKLRSKEEHGKIPQASSSSNGQQKEHKHQEGHRDNRRRDRHAHRDKFQKKYDRHLGSESYYDKNELKQQSERKQHSKKHEKTHSCERSSRERTNDRHHFMKSNHSRRRESPGDDPGPKIRTSKPKSRQDLTSEDELPSRAHSKKNNNDRSTSYKESQSNSRNLVEARHQALDHSRKKSYSDDSSSSSTDEKSHRISSDKSHEKKSFQKKKRSGSTSNDESSLDSHRRQRSSPNKDKPHNTKSFVNKKQKNSTSNDERRHRPSSNTDELRNSKSIGKKKQRRSSSECRKSKHSTGRSHVSENSITKPSSKKHSRRKHSSTSESSSSESDCRRNRVKSASRSKNKSPKRKRRYQNSESSSGSDVRSKMKYSQRPEFYETSRNKQR